MIAYGGYIIGIGFCGIVSGTVTAVRFWVRGAPLKELSPSEYVILLSQFLHFALVAVDIAGLLVYVEKSAPIEAVFKIFLASTLIYFVGLWSIKISVCLLYLRLTRGSKMHYVATATMIYIVLTGVASVLLELLGCEKFSDHWNYASPCHAKMRRSIFWSQAFMNLSTDLFLFLLPFPLLRTITNPRLKVALAVVFALGGMVIILSVVGVVLLSLNRPDTLDIAIIIVNIECALCMVVSALPGLSRSIMRKQQRPRQNKVGFQVPGAKVIPEPKEYVVDSKTNIGEMLASDEGNDAYAKKNAKSGSNGCWIGRRMRGREKDERTLQASDGSGRRLWDWKPSKVRSEPTDSLADLEKGDSLEECPTLLDIGGLSGKSLP